MRSILAITRKELEQYFASPIAYIVVTLFLVLSGIFFYIYLQFYLQQAQMASMQGGAAGELSQAVMRPFFANVSFFFLVIFPLLTMKLLAEEKKLGTYELLMTSPISTAELLLGKFLGAVSMMIVILVILALYPLILMIFGHPDFGPILTGFLGLILLGSAFLAVGIFSSSITENQIVAAVTAFVFLIIFWILNFLSRSEAWYGKLFQYAAIYQHLDNFTQGVLNLNDVVYYISFTFFALFVTAVVLQSQRWKS